MLSAGLPMQFTNSANLLPSIQIFQCPFIHLVTSVGNFHSLRTVICPYVPHAMSTKTHFSSDRSWIYRFPTLPRRTGVLKYTL